MHTRAKELLVGGQVTGERVAALNAALSPSEGGRGGASEAKGDEAPVAHASWATRVAKAWNSLGCAVQEVIAGHPKAPDDSDADSTDDSDAAEEYSPPKGEREAATWREAGAHLCAAVAVFGPPVPPRVVVADDTESLMLEWHEAPMWGTVVHVRVSGREPESVKDADGRGGDLARAATPAIEYWCYHRGVHDTAVFKATQFADAASTLERWVRVPAADWCIRQLGPSAATAADVATMVRDGSAPKVLGDMRDESPTLEDIVAESLSDPDETSEAEIAKWKGSDDLRVALRVFLRHLATIMDAVPACREPGGRSVRLSADDSTAVICWGATPSIGVAGLHVAPAADDTTDDAAAQVVGYAITVSPVGELDFLGPRGPKFGRYSSFQLSDSLENAAEAAPFMVAVLVHKRHWGCSGEESWRRPGADHADAVVRQDNLFVRLRLGFTADLEFACALRQLFRQLWVAETAWNDERARGDVASTWQSVCTRLYWVAFAALQRRSTAHERLHCALDPDRGVLVVWSQAIERANDACWNVLPDDLPVHLTCGSRGTTVPPLPTEDAVRALSAFHEAARKYTPPADGARQLTCNSLCRRYTRGRCDRGKECPFLHAHLDNGGNLVDFEFEEDKEAKCAMCDRSLIQPADKWLRDTRDVRRRFVRSVTSSVDCDHCYHWGCWDKWENDKIALGQPAYCPDCPVEKRRAHARVVWAPCTIGSTDARAKLFTSVCRSPRVRACKFLCLGLPCPWDQDRAASGAGSSTLASGCPFSHDAKQVARVREKTYTTDLKDRLETARELLKLQDDEFSRQFAQDLANKDIESIARDFTRAVALPDVVAERPHSSGGAASSNAAPTAGVVAVPPENVARWQLQLFVLRNKTELGLEGPSKVGAAVASAWGRPEEWGL